MSTTESSGDQQTIQREILRQVASGEMGPDEAAELLAELERQAKGGPGTRTGAEDGPPEGPRSLGLETVRITAAFRSVQVVGDPAVNEAFVAEGGHHSITRADGVLTIAVDNDDEDGYSFSGRGGPFAGRLGPRLWGVGQRRLRTVVIRVHPDLGLDVELSAGTLSVAGVTGPVRARVSAGSLRVDDFAAPLDIAVSAGSVNARGVLAGGDSVIECDAGKVRVVLEPGSSVRVQARADLGKVDIHGAGDEGSSEWLLGQGHDATIGGGAGSLKIRASMGAVQVVAP